ncbi:unnamed protein product [Rotaria sp. Silwood2]|nr:unnamed protein product [Rotaria sp. Silwood2]CAF2941647.1 unnamed protein product [Rotaria sp. Silwood2]CAF4086277.1 unnamed protein product [Rotaria sp. Silwood2]
MHRQMDNSTSASTTILSTNLSSFVYEDLICYIQVIQNQMIEIARYLDTQWKNDMTIRQDLKSRSITFIDPYSTPMINKYMDHESIRTLFKKYKKDYIPKYFILISRDDYQFITYDKLNISIEYSEDEPPRQFVIRVLVMYILYRIF